MFCVGLLFKWINVLIITGCALYYSTSKLLPSLKAHLRQNKKKRKERLSSLHACQEQRMLIEAAIEQQHVTIQQLTAKIDQWHTHEMQAKKKLQSTHAKIYHDAKNRIEQQTQFLVQHTLLLKVADALIDTTQKQLSTTINQAQQRNYIETVLSVLKKDIHGL